MGDSIDKLCNSGTKFDAHLHSMTLVMKSENDNKNRVQASIVEVLHTKTKTIGNYNV